MAWPHIVDCPLCGTNVAIYGEKIDTLVDKHTGKIIKIIKCQRCGQWVPTVLQGKVK